MNLFDCDNALELLDCVGDDGRIMFDPTGIYWVKRAEEESELEYHRAVIESTLHKLRPFLSMRFQRTKVGYKEAGVVFDGTNLSFEVGPIILVPDGKAGLVEFQELLASMRPFYSEFKDKKPRITLTNNRDHHRRTYTELRALYNVDENSDALHAKETEEMLMARITTSDTLRTWFKAVSLDLNKLGPWSWLTIRSEDLFSSGDDPVRQLSLDEMSALLRQMEASSCEFD